MGRTSKTFALILMLIIVMSCLTLVVVKPANAQTIPKPSVPEFTLKFLDNYYHPTIEITIKNQVYPTTINDSEVKLYYNLRSKSHPAENWSEQYVVSPSTLTVQSNSQYTQLTYTPNYPTGEKVDLQVEAILGYNEYTTAPENPTIRFAHFTTQSSDWSPTQTFTMPNNPTITSTLSPSSKPIYIPENVLLAIIAVIAVTALLLAVFLLLLYKRNRNPLH
jgi:hypothetical protein